MSSLNTGKRLAKNTAFMYIRMLILMVISFYTTRVVLKKLGVEDFGIFNVVGSIIVMFSSLRTLISSATQRYLNHEMGLGRDDRLKIVFNMSVYINIIISIIFLVVVEIIGTWFLNNKANIPVNRELAAMLVFQFSVLSAVVSIFTTSYDAVIIAHERMDFFACMSIIEGSLKLAVVYLLSYIPGDDLSNYGWLLLVTTLIVFILNALYARLKFAECKFAKLWDKRLFKEMLAFSGWNFFGKASMALTQSGLNMLLNIFGGPIVNAARGVAYQLNSATNQFINNVNVVLDPFFIRTYAEKEKNTFFKAFFFSSKILYFIQLCLVIPFAILADSILNIWLGQVPEYSVLFLRLVLIWSLIRAPHSPIDKYFKAVGDIKKYQILEGVILALPLVFAYIFLKLEFGYSSVFITMILFEAINLLIIVSLACNFKEMSFISYIRFVVVPCVLFSIPFSICMVLVSILEYNVMTRVFISIGAELASAILFYFVGLNVSEKQYLKLILTVNKHL